MGKSKINLFKSKSFRRGAQMKHSQVNYKILNCKKCGKDIKYQDKCSPNHVLSGHFRACKGKIENEEVEIEFIEYDDYDISINSSSNSNSNIMMMSQSNCCPRQFLFQDCLEKKYISTKHALKINKTKSNDERANISDVLKIFNFSINEGLSNSSIDNLLKLFHGILSTNEVIIPLPNNHSTLHRQCKDGIISSENSMFNLLEWKYSLDEDLFPLHRNYVTFYSYDVMEIISEMLLNIDPLKFVRNPDSRTTSTGDRIYEDFSTGNNFQYLTEAIRNNSGNPNAVALCIGITLDETQIRSGARTFTPVYIYILNAYDDQFRMELLGFAPENKLPYSNEAIKKTLNETYNSNKTKGKKGIINNIIKYHKRKFQLQYLYDILKKTLDSQSNGVKFRVGRFDNVNGYEIEAYIHLCIISGDNKQLDYLGGISMRSNSKPCRICNTEQCHSIDNEQCIGTFRDDNEMQRIGKLLQVAIKDHCSLQNSKLPESITDAYKLCKQNGMLITAGENPLIKLFEWQYTRNISSFYKSLVPDVLHTFIKGLMEYAITWSYICFKTLQEVDQAYSSNLSDIDDRIKNFPTIQSLKIFDTKQRHRFKDGISELFKNSSNHKNKHEDTGFFAGGSIEAWKIPQLLF